MAEAVGVLASIITILDLAGKVMGYLHSASHVDDERQRLKTEISDSVVILTILQARIRDASLHALSLKTTEALATSGGPLERFEADLKAIDRAVAPVPGSGRLKTTVDKATWPLKKTKVNELIDSLNRQKILFNLALQDDHMFVHL